MGMMLNVELIYLVGEYNSEQVTSQHQVHYGPKEARSNMYKVPEVVEYCVFVPVFPYVRSLLIVVLTLG